MSRSRRAARHVTVRPYSSRGVTDTDTEASGWTQAWGARLGGSHAAAGAHDHDDGATVRPPAAGAGTKGGGKRAVSVGAYRERGFIQESRVRR